VGGVWPNDAESAAARAEIPGPGCEDGTAPARGVKIPGEDPVINVWVDTWRL
jgi:hypothetical protein